MEQHKARIKQIQMQEITLPPSPDDADRDAWLRQVSDALDDVTFTYQALVLTQTENEVVIRKLPEDYE